MYEFRCHECGLRFEKLIHDSTIKTHNCLSCGESAQRCLADPSFVFGSGSTVGNTGVDSLDSSIDKGVGRNAEKRWEAVKDRNSYKRKVQRSNGGEGKVPLRKNPHTGEYEPMESKEVTYRHKLRSEHEDLYREHKERREKQGISKFSDTDSYSKYRRHKKEKSDQ